MYLAGLITLEGLGCSNVLKTAIISVMNVFYSHMMSVFVCTVMFSHHMSSQKLMVFFFPAVMDGRALPDNDRLGVNSVDWFSLINQ